MPTAKVQPARASQPRATAPKPAAASSRKVAVKATAKTTARPAAKRQKVTAFDAAAPAGTESASQMIDARIEELGDWRGAMLARLRALIQQAVPDVTEEWKWRGTPVWSHHGIICTGETYKQVVKATFAKGAALADPASLFNSSLDGNVRRAIDFREGDEVNEAALKALILAAVALNKSTKRR